MQRYDPSLHRDLYNVFLKDFGVFARFYLGLTETVLGNVEAGAQWAEQSFELAERVKRPHTVGFGLISNFATAMLRGDVERADEYSRRSLEYSSNHGFPEFVAMSRICRGWVDCNNARLDEGINEMAEGASAWNATGFTAWQPVFAALQAEWMIKRGQIAAAQALLDKYEVRVAETGEAQASALLKLARAEAAHASGDQALAADLITDATEVATQQQTMLWLQKIRHVARERNIE